MLMADKITQRKKDHLKLALSPKAQIGDPGFSRFRFTHNALPELDFDSIDTSTVFLGKKVAYPIFISCMTGGITQGKRLNKNLALTAQKCNIPMGIGSQRIALERPELESLFQIRRYAPDIPVIANIGLVQLNYGYGIKELQRCIDMVDADALAVHINPIQEALQPEGDRNFASLLPRLAKIIPKLSKPVILKEVGFGLSYGVAKRGYASGIRYFDTAGWGGTNWGWIELMRQSSRTPSAFTQWGIPTTNSIIQLKRLKNEVKDKITVLGSGGVRSGLDIAKALALGADLVGIATPFAQAALVSHKAIEDLILTYAHDLKLTMFGVGAGNIKALQKTNLERFD